MPKVKITPKAKVEPKKVWNMLLVSGVGFMAGDGFAVACVPAAVLKKVKKIADVEEVKDESIVRKLKPVYSG